MLRPLSLSKTSFFSTLCVWISPNTDENSQAHVLTFYAFALQMLFYTRRCAYC